MGGLARPGEDDGLDVGVRDEVPADRPFVGADDLRDVGGDAGGVDRGHADLDAPGGGVRGLDDDGRAGGERGEHTAERDGDGEVPRRRHERHRGGPEPRTVGDETGAQVGDPIGVVAGEVDRLAHLGVGLFDRLAALGGHDREELPAALLHLTGGGPQQRGAFGGRSRDPLPLGAQGGGDDLVDGLGRPEHRRGEGREGGPERRHRPLPYLGEGGVGIRCVVEHLAELRALGATAWPDRRARDRLDRLAVALLLLGHRAVGGGGARAVVEDRVEEVAGGGVLLEAADEVADRDVEVLGRDDGGVEEHGADGLLDGARLRGRHALEHLDVEGVGHASLLREEVGGGDVEEVVARDTDADRGGAAVDRGGGVLAQGALDAAQVVGVDLGLRVVGGLL